MLFPNTISQLPWQHFSIKTVYIFADVFKDQFSLRAPNPPHLLSEMRDSFLSPLCSRCDFTVSYQYSRLPGTKRYISYTQTHSLRWNCMPISQADSSPIFSCVVLSHSSVTHTLSTAVTQTHQLLSSQEALLHF